MYHMLLFAFFQNHGLYPYIKQKNVFVWVKKWDSLVKCKIALGSQNCPLWLHFMAAFHAEEKSGVLLFILFSKPTNHFPKEKKGVKCFPTFFRKKLNTLKHSPVLDFVQMK